MITEKRHNTLSKTSILQGLQCPKALYLSKNPPPIEIPPDPDQEATFKMGREVGLLARQLFPGGTEVPFSNFSLSDQVSKTKELIDSGVNVIHEGAFTFDNIFIKTDILVRLGETWEINEVKMSTSIKDINYDDAAIQYYVVSNSGLPVSGVNLIHINNKYERHGDIDVQQLFVSEDVTELVLARQKNLPKIIKELREMLQGDEPDIDIDRYCTNPYSCEFESYCWQHIPEDSIFSLKGRGIDKFDFYKKGIIKLEDLPLDKLNDAQRFQVIATINKKDMINTDSVKAFLETLWYPLCYLDFETFDTPIPPFDGTQPYQKIPFQYSLHIQEEEGAEPTHFEYLAEPCKDPRRELAEKLLSEIPENACVLTYNQTFEKGVLKHLATAFSDLADEINVRIENIRDLMVPFKRRDIYHWQMHGSYSIKEVLPALVSELSYKGLDISNGMKALRGYHEMCKTADPVKYDNLRQGLLEYCRLDTLAMVKINLATTKKLLLARAGNRCSFPGCNMELVTSDGTPIAEICHIEAMSEGGPRYNSDLKTNQEYMGKRIIGLDDLIVLCPTHHRLVDSDPIKYNADWLRAARTKHERNISLKLSPIDKYTPRTSTSTITSFHKSLDIWQQNIENGDEEFWQQLFKANPKLIAQAVPNHIIQIGDKCYVGGKDLLNKGGKIVDFLYATRTNKNIVIVEIKTPTTQLLGQKYRVGIYSISEELTGAVIQTLNYRNILLKDYFSINRNNAFQALDPTCLVIAGNLKTEGTSPEKRTSFDLYRSNSSVVILTYDELFSKIESLLELLDEEDLDIE